MGPAIGRTAIADQIVRRFEQIATTAQSEFAIPGVIPSFQVKDLLSADLAREIFVRFPAPGRMMLKRSIKENKRVAAQMDAFDPLIEEAVYAFQDPRVLALISRITGFRDLEPDLDLYAGGISTMSKGAYLRPHLDNSHDKDQDRYRVINVLYYVTPDWQPEYGGSLQLWDEGPGGTVRTFPCFFNSVIIMATGKNSWHSVNEVMHDGIRCCVSNYYFSRHSPDNSDYFHATSFRGEPGHRFLDLVMRTDNLLRTAVLKLFRGLLSEPTRIQAGLKRKHKKTIISPSRCASIDRQSPCPGGSPPRRACNKTDLRVAVPEVNVHLCNYKPQPILENP